MPGIRWRAGLPGVCWRDMSNLPQAHTFWREWTRTEQRLAISHRRVGVFTVIFASNIGGQSLAHFSVLAAHSLFELVVRPVLLGRLL
jgi:hypothetical protein